LVRAIAKKSGTATSELRILSLSPFPAICLKPRVALAPDHQVRRRLGGGDGSKITCPEGMFVNKSHFFSGCLALVAIVSSMSRVHAGVIAIDLTGKTGDNAGSAPNWYLDLGPLTPGTTNSLYAFSNLSDFPGSVTGLSLQSGGGIAATGFGSFDTPVKFNAGEVIGSSSFFVDSYSPTVFRNPFRTVGDFGANSFLGFKDSLGRYGYIEVTWDSSTDKFRMISAAYESVAGVGIQTPGGAVPEPTSMAMFLLGGLGVAYRVRRKSKA